MSMFIKTAKDAFKTVKRRFYLVPIAVLLDLLFIFFYGFITSFTANSIMSPLQNIIILSTRIVSDAEFIKNPVGYFFQNNEFLSNIKLIAIYLLIFALLFYFICVLFQGSAWFVAKKMISKKVKFKSYIAEFAAVFALWLISLVIITTSLAVFAFTTLMSFQPVMDSSTIILLSMIFDVVLVYFIFISLAFIGEGPIKNIKKTLKTGVFKIHFILIAYLIIVLIALLLNFIIILASNIGFLAMLISGILILLPFFTIARIYLIKIMETIKS